MVLLPLASSTFDDAHSQIDRETSKILVGHVSCFSHKHIRVFLESPAIWLLKEVRTFALVGVVETEWIVGEHPAGKES